LLDPVLNEAKEVSPEL
jgi:hypothetical protein